MGDWDPENISQPLHLHLIHHPVGSGGGEGEGAGLGGGKTLILAEGGGGAGPFIERLGTGVRVTTIDPGFAETAFSLVRFKGDAERAKKVYDGVIPLTAEDVAETILWVADRPPHVCIDELVIKCTDQAAIHKVHRRPVK